MSTRKSIVVILCLMALATIGGCSDSPSDTAPSDSSDASFDAGDIADGDAGMIPDADAINDSGADSYDGQDSGTGCPTPEPPPVPGTYSGPCRVETRSVESPEFGEVETYTYDSQGRNTRYERDGDLTSSHIPDGDPEYVLEYTYDGRGLLVERRVESHVGGNDSVWDLVYDDTTFLFEERETTIQESGTFPGSLYVHRKDACGRKARTEVYPPGKWRDSDPLTVRTFEYGPSGRLVQIQTYVSTEFPESGGEAIGTTEFEYDVDGRLVRELRARAGQPERTETITYEYDDGRLIKSSGRIGEPGELVGYVIYSYDDDGNLIGSETYDAHDTHVDTTSITYGCW